MLRGVLDVAMATVGKRSANSSTAAGAAGGAIYSQVRSKSLPVDCSRLEHRKNAGLHIARVTVVVCRRWLISLLAGALFVHWKPY